MVAPYVSPRRMGTKYARGITWNVPAIRTTIEGQSCMKTCAILTCVACFAFPNLVAFAQVPASSMVTKSQPEGRKNELRFAGAWVTTKNKKLDGNANCEVKQLSTDHWQGKFWGVWQHVPFDYTVEFTADKPKQKGELSVAMTDNLADRPGGKDQEHRVVGKAVIDGATYDWTG